MKKTIINFLVVVSCLLVFFFRYELIATYLSYKYPSPVIFSDLTIPIEKGGMYNITEKSIRISNPLNDEYALRITRDFSFTTDSSFEEYLKQLDHMIVKIETIENKNCRYVKALSVDKRWLFNVSIYIPKKKLMLSYRGSKRNYPQFNKILDENLIK